MARLRSLFDPFLLALLATVLAATLLPATGTAKIVFDWLGDIAILLLFFLHGAKLSRAAIIEGAGKWKLHLAVLATSFLLYPLLGVAARAAVAPAAPVIADGLLFLTLLPSTVQSSIAFTSIAGGNVPAAIASASLSNIVGILVTPLLAALLMGASGGGGTADSILKVGGQLLLPFLAGHFARPLIGGLVERHRALVFRVDRGSILLLVYSAFSAAVVEGIWRRTDVGGLALAALGGLVILALVLWLSRLAARRLGWPVADEIVLRFCGSKKSLVSGVPLAAAIFPAGQAGMLLLPLMIFHQMQLMICSVLARRYAEAAPRR
ncbi:bile acid:sodium symporter family protein [Sphingomonas morindae]|uniref:Bile acid:sodium symporter n=1 Tax=Sphingomonas morindae TaxID=1541170 RepID=A0ABY4XCL3_9SPHN|nr:bile acid:sodium symporter family protein [Sphingomonas morindae]USI74471.1 bile acid:sodium symporter [Sphingomonas morindae]